MNTPTAGCSVSGQQVLTWSLGTNNLGAALPVIKFRAQIALGVASGSNLTNSAIIESPADGSTLAQRTASRNVGVLSPAVFSITKTATPSQIQSGDTFSYVITYQNTSATPANKPDVIDILPYAGDGSGTWNGVAEGRSPATSFAGTLQLLNLAAALPSGYTLYVTNAAPASIDKSPSAASNLNPGVGASMWCPATLSGGVVTLTGGGASCAGTTAGNLTAIRVLDNDSNFITSSGARILTLTFATTGNTAGNIYTNDTSAFAASGLALPVLSGDVAVPVVGATLGDRVFEDLNGNGVQDASDPGINGVTVTLAGINSLGVSVNDNTVTANVGGVAGIYRFTNLRSGNYTVTFAQPTGWVRSTKALVGVAATDSNIPGNSTSLSLSAAPVALGIGVTDNTVDAGYVRTGSLSGSVNVGTSTAIVGGTITLTGLDAFGNTVTQVTTTGVGGTYSFANVLPGSYTVTQSQPAAYSASLAVAGSAGGTVSGTNVITSVPLQSGQAATGYNFVQALGALLSVTKTDGRTTVSAGGSVTYTIVVNNAGPSDASGAVLRDQPSTGLSCATGGISCVATGGAVCPSVAPAATAIASLLSLPTFPDGLTIPALPNGGRVTITLTCAVKATGF